MAQNILPNHAIRGLWFSSLLVTDLLLTSHSVLVISTLYRDLVCLVSPFECVLILSIGKFWLLYSWKLGYASIAFWN